MKITRLETLMANAGLRNYLFVRLTTDTGLTGIGEASLEWQEKTVETLIHEWVEGRVIGCDPFDVERVIGNMIRDQYQGGSTVMTAISSVEIALWDIIGKACGQPVYKLIGGRYHAKIPAYANGWYGNAHTPFEYAEQAAAAVDRGYKALKFDPFGVAWKGLNAEQFEAAVEIVTVVRNWVGDDVQLMIEFHGRLSAGSAISMMRALEPFHPAWCEEPVAPENLGLLAEVKREARSPISTGERLYTMADFYRLISLRAADVVQMDVAHCGGILMSKKIAALAAAQDMQIAPHCSIGPVALAAALHVDVSTPNFLIQEAFSDFDVPWRSDLVCGWNPIKNAEFFLSDSPGLGLELDDDAIAAHPYIQNPFPSLWDANWITDFKQDEKTMSDYRELKQAIIDACLLLEARGDIIGTYGNASARIPGGLIVTPSRVDYHVITPDDMMTVADDGSVIDGHRIPSSETSVHRLIYRARPDVGAVLHTHSFYATALSCLHVTVPVIVEEQSQVVGDEIRCTNYVPAGQHEKLGEEVARALGKSNGVLLANHGVVACGRTIDEALFVTQVVERVAHMRLFTGGAAIPIPQHFVESERERWLYKYGTAADHGQNDPGALS